MMSSSYVIALMLFASSACSFVNARPPTAAEEQAAELELHNARDQADLDRLFAAQGYDLGGVGGGEIIGYDLGGVGGGEIIGYDLGGVGGGEIIGYRIRTPEGREVILMRDLGGVGGGEILGRFQTADIAASHGKGLRGLSGLGGGNLLKARSNLSGLGKGNLVRNLNSLGGGQLLKTYKK